MTLKSLIDSIDYDTVLPVLQAYYEPWNVNKGKAMYDELKSLEPTESTVKGVITISSIEDTDGSTWDYMYNVSMIDGDTKYALDGMPRSQVLSIEIESSMEPLHVLANILLEISYHGYLEQDVIESLKFE